MSLVLTKAPYRDGPLFFIIVQSSQYYNNLTKNNNAGHNYYNIVAAFRGMHVLPAKQLCVTTKKV